MGKFNVSMLKNFSKLEKPVSTRGRRGFAPEKGNFVKLFHPPSDLCYLTFSNDAGSELSLNYEKRVDLAQAGDEGTFLLVIEAGDSAQFGISYQAKGKGDKKSGFKVSHKSLKNLKRGKYKFVSTHTDKLAGYSGKVTFHVYEWVEDVVSVSRPRGSKKDKGETDTSKPSKRRVVEEEEDEEVDELDEEEDEEVEEVEEEEDEEDDEEEDEDEDEDEEEEVAPRKGRRR